MLKHTIVICILLVSHDVLFHLQFATMKVMAQALSDLLANRDKICVELDRIILVLDLEIAL